MSELVSFFLHTPQERQQFVVEESSCKFAMCRRSEKERTYTKYHVEHLSPYLSGGV